MSSLLASIAWASRLLVYYTNLFAVTTWVKYGAFGQRGLDPAVDKAFTDMCGPEFVRYPLEYVKTVESHVNQIFAKLEVSSRRAVIAWVKATRVALLWE